MNEFELKTYYKYNKFLTKIRYEFYKIKKYLKGKKIKVDYQISLELPDQPSFSFNVEI